MNTALAAFFTGLWAFLKGMGPHLRDASLVAAGMVIKGLEVAAKDNGKLVDQYKAILEEERKAVARTNHGAAGKLRNSGYTTDDPDA